MTRLLCIACEVFARPLYLSAAYSRKVIDIQLLERGLHNQPDILRETIQRSIDQAEGKEYAHILLGYGLCGNGSAGLQSRSIPLVIPRAHDCIALLLGSRKRYQEQFEQTPGTYWYSQDFLERNYKPGQELSMGPVDAVEREKKLQEMIVKYGRDNAEYLMQVMGDWENHYDRAVYIDTGLSADSSFEDGVKKDADQRNWSFEKMAGDLILFKKLLDGAWQEDNNNDFILIPPGNIIEPSNDGEIFSCGKPCLN